MPNFIKITFFVTFILSCSEVSEKRNVQSLKTHKIETENFDYKKTLKRIEKINYGGSYELFLKEWKDLHLTLKKVSENGFYQLTQNQQSTLWWSIEYMRGCAHHEIPTNHNEEIIPILFSFNLPKLNKDLKEILIQSGQM